MCTYQLEPKMYCLNEAHLMMVMCVDSTVGTTAVSLLMDETLMSSSLLRAAFSIRPQLDVCRKDTGEVLQTQWLVCTGKNQLYT